MTIQAVNIQKSELGKALFQRRNYIKEVGLRDLKRYYSLLAKEVAHFSFSIGEALLICDVLQSYPIDEGLERCEEMAVQICDEIKDNRSAQKEKIDSEHLINKLEPLSCVQILALSDAVEQFWAKREANPNEKITELLLNVGLLNCCYFAL